ncbi:MAG: deoxyribose-phosphate aldolase [Mycoplasmataceae bacterium]|jgi:deoxyribose-phosphate aldolase|nr:deoxyribose-phosphate aldolase [Mycoplasmataceae bacterium]
MEYNKYIDHTLLRADATAKEIVKLCQEARIHNFMSVCVNPDYVPLCKKQLANSKVKICTVIGFPLGSNTTKTKIKETIDAIKNGAQEIDMVVNISWLKAKQLTDVVNEIKLVKKACGSLILKVIVETALLNRVDKINACKCVMAAKADFIKTSTGFSSGGATVADVKLFKKCVGNKISIKASGGIKTRQDMLALIKAGANRIGTSRGIALMQD